VQAALRHSSFPKSQAVLSFRPAAGGPIRFVPHSFWGKDSHVPHLWKLLALTVVVGVVWAFVMQRKRGMQETDAPPNSRRAPIRMRRDFRQETEPGRTPEQGEPEMADSNDGDVTPAIAKTRRTGQSESAILKTGGTKDRGSTTVADDEILRRPELQ